MRGRRAFIVLTIYLGTAGAHHLRRRTWSSRPTARDDFGGGGFVNQANTLRDRRPDDLHASLDLPAHPHLLHRTRLHRRADQPRAREADARPAREHTDASGGDRPRQAPRRARLRRADDRGGRADHGDRADVRRRLGRRHRAPAAGAARDGGRARRHRPLLLRAAQADAGRDRPELHHDAGADGRDGHALRLLDPPHQPGRTASASVRPGGRRSSCSTSTRASRCSTSSATRSRAASAASTACWLSFAARRRTSAAGSTASATCASRWTSSANPVDQAARDAARATGGRGSRSRSSPSPRS